MKKSRILEVLSGLIDLIVAGLLWILCSLPVVTLGAASSALYYAVVKCVRHNRGSLAATFFQGFRDNFRPATLIWLLMLLYSLVGLADAYAIRLMGFGPGSILYTLSFCFFLPPVFLFPWVFAFLTRFQNTVAGTLKYCGWLALRNIGRTFGLVLLYAGTGLICWLIPFLIPLLPAAICLTASLLIEPVFRILQQDAPDRNADAWYNE